MLGASIRARSADALDSTKRFTAKLDLCLNIVTVKSRDNRRGPLWNTFVLAWHLYPYLQSSNRSFFDRVCLPSITTFTVLCVTPMFSSPAAHSRRTWRLLLLSECLKFFDKSGDRVICQFRLILQNQRASVGNAYPLNLRVFRERLP